MKKCTFYGHRHTSAELRPVLLRTIRTMIEKMDVGVFYVGDKGDFDRMAESCVRELREEYPHIRLNVVLSRMPGTKGEFETEKQDTLYPDGLESVPPRFGIIYRNHWMADRCDYAVVNVCGRGGATDAASYADRKGVKILNISDAASASYFEYRNTFSIEGECDK